MSLTINKLPETFIGGGEVSGFLFEKVKEDDKTYTYKVTSEGRSWYEHFLKKTAAVCVDFNKRIYSETEFSERYPKSNAFGAWAWTKMSI